MLQKQEFSDGIVLYCGDCLEIMPSLDLTVDMVLNDPPYGTTKNHWDCVVPYEEMWANLNRLAKINAAMCFFSAQPFATDLIQSNRAAFRYDLVWEKTLAVGFLNANRMPLRNHELILMFYRELPDYFPQKTAGTPYVSTGRSGSHSTNYGKFDPIPIHNESGDRHPVSVWKCSIDSDRQHPTQKPVPLLKRLILSYTQEGEMVLDFTMGSGSAAVACVETKRKFVGIEREAKYFDIACERVERAAAQGVLF